MCWGTSSGRLSQLAHFGPLITIFLVTFIATCGLQCLLQWWPPNTPAAKIHLGIYAIWPFVIFYNYFNAIFLGPGFVPKNWRPKNKEDELKLQYCKECNSFKAPRSHHCRKCKRCVLKMDHHCPVYFCCYLDSTHNEWINTCCGHRNHASFVYFLITAPLGCLHAALVLSPSIYRAVFRNYYVFYDVTDVPIVNLSIVEIVLCMFAVGMAFGVSIAVGILFGIQLKIILRNQTGIEEWIVRKANHRREHLTNEPKFVYPYGLGRKENLRQVFNWTGNFRPIGDGISWNVADGCDQFTLTAEQLMQKEEKRTHALKYVATLAYSGSTLPCSTHGCKTACCMPWSEEPRLAIRSGDVLLVTRWQKHWLYGEKVLTPTTSMTTTSTTTTTTPKTTTMPPQDDAVDSTKAAAKKANCAKGWFPSQCVRMLDEGAAAANSSTQGDDSADAPSTSLMPSPQSTVPSNETNGFVSHKKTD